MNLNNNQNLNQQLLLNSASRKNNYLIAKWFNLATFIGSAISFFIFLIVTIVTANQFKMEANQAVMKMAFIFMLIIALINSIVSFVFWSYTRGIAEQVGTVDEVPHTAFGVFNFLFGNWISGIFILIASASFNRSQTLISLNHQQTFNQSEE